MLSVSIRQKSESSSYSTCLCVRGRARLQLYPTPGGQDNPVSRVRYLGGATRLQLERAGYQPEGMVSNAWAKGYKLGIVASSDHGSTHISYAMVYTDTPTRQGILDAIRKRHTYGAMDNIILDVRMGDWFMGDEFALSRALPIQVKARGTAPIARVDVIKDSKVIYTAEPKKQDVALEYTDRGDVGGRHYYYVRVQQDNGLAAWSSPFFVNYR